MGLEHKASGFYEWDAEPRLSQPRAVGIESGRVDACLAHLLSAGSVNLLQIRANTWATKVW